jgi:tetratricopeptide (TPR) repeat protein
MPNRMMRAAVLAGFVLFPSIAAAQQKSAPTVMEQTTSSAAARDAFKAALVEVENFGGKHRINPKLQTTLQADQTFALARAYYGAWGVGLSAAEREAELKRALKDAADASTPELLFVAGLREMQAGNRNLARNLVDLARELARDDPHIAWLRMLLAIDDEDAMRVGEAAIIAFPDYAPILNLLAYRLQDLKRRHEALLRVQQYVGALPDHPNSHDSYAELLQLNGRLDEAATHYSHSIELDPRYEAAHEGMAEVEVLRGNYASARRHLEEGIKYASEPARVLQLQRELAAVMLYEGKLREAHTMLAATVATAKQNRWDAANDERALAFIALLQGRTTDAASQLRAADPNVSWAWDDAMYYLITKQSAEVEKAVAAIAAKYPNSAVTRAARVLGALAQGDLPAARARHKELNDQAYKAFTAALMLPVFQQMDDEAAVQALMADIDAYRTLAVDAGLVRAIAQRK